MAKRHQKESDSVYFLKIVLFFILGGVWVAFDRDTGVVKTIPVGFIVGVLFAMHDHFQIDRKIEYAILLASAALSFVAPLGLILLL